MTRTRTLGAAFVLATAGLTVQGQDQPPTFRTEANYVRVDVFPTRDGVPILDLGKDDFEILDQGVPQTIDQFAHVSIPGNVPQSARREPRNVAESREMLQDPGARVLVLFFDTPHVDLSSSRRIGPPLIDLLERHLGADDLIGLMAPGMAARDVTFARRTIALQSQLAKSWWGARDRVEAEDPVEDLYKVCYSAQPGDGDVSPVAQEMIDRRREQRTLDALEDLVVYLGRVREERKAILVITAGWRLFRRNPALVDTRASGVPPIGIDPRTGRPGLLQTFSSGTGAQVDCDADRRMLADLDLQEQFDRITAEANRANASFYPVDPRGLAAFDSPLGPSAPPPPSEDAARLRARQFNLRSLAVDTDGLAVVGMNDLSGGFDRIAADLSSYYLLGYYATGVRMDGAFHRITVRVKRPGVDMRARPGYLAPSPEEFAAATRASTTNAPAAPDPAAAAIDAALEALAPFDVERPLRLQAASGWTADGAAAWIAAEVGADAGWAGGSQLDAIVTTADGEIVGSARGRMEAGSRSLVMSIESSTALSAGRYRISVRARALSGGESASAEVPLAIAPDPGTSGALLYRRGPSTGTEYVLTSDARFRRNERLRVEIVGTGAPPPTAQLLGRDGSTLAIPIATGVREADGMMWQTAEVTLAPLAAGDYLIELTAGSERVLTAFRILR